MSSATRRIHAANSPAENPDKYIDYVNRYYDMIQQEKLSNKKKVEEAIKRQNFDVDQIQATNAGATTTPKLEASPPSPPQPTAAFHAHPAADADQHNFRNAPRGDNFYPASPEHYCDAGASDKANLSMALTPYKYSPPPPTQRIADERSYEIVPAPAASLEPYPLHYDAYPANYEYYPPPPPRSACSCFRQPNAPPLPVAQIPRAGYDLRELAPPARDSYRSGPAAAQQHWHDGAACAGRYDKCGDNDFAQQHHPHPYGHYAAPYYGAAAQSPQHFNPVEMMHPNNANNSYNYFSAPRPPLVPKHSPYVYNVSSPLVPKEIQRNPPQKPPSTSFMNSMRLEWEKNFNAARIERGNNLLKNR